MQIAYYYNLDIIYDEKEKQKTKERICIMFGNEINLQSILFVRIFVALIVCLVVCLFISLIILIKITRV